MSQENSVRSKGQKPLLYRYFTDFKRALTGLVKC